MTNLESVTKRQLAHSRRQQGQKGVELVSVKMFRRSQLPQNRPKLRPEFLDAARNESLDGIFRARQVSALNDEARRFDGKHELVRSRIAPFGEYLRLLQAIECAVDLDRCDLSARVLKFPTLGRAGWIESLAPWLVLPTANADAEARGLNAQREPPERCAVDRD